MAIKAQSLVLKGFIHTVILLRNGFIGTNLDYNLALRSANLNFSPKTMLAQCSNLTHVEYLQFDSLYRRDLSKHSERSFSLL